MLELEEIKEKALYKIILDDGFCIIGTMVQLEPIMHENNIKKIELLKSSDQISILKDFFKSYEESKLNNIDKFYKTKYCK